MTQTKHLLLLGILIFSLSIFACFDDLDRELSRRMIQIERFIEWKLVRKFPIIEINPY